MAWACLRKPFQVKWAASLAADAHHRHASTLAHQTVRAGLIGEGNPQVRRGIVLHGLMGAAKNLLPLCKRLLDNVIQHSPPNSAEQLCTLDSIPGMVDAEQTGETERVLSTIRSFPNPVPSHRWLLEKLMEKGFTKSLAVWIASNVKRRDARREEMTWIFDFDDIYDMFLSYRQSCYLKFLEHPPEGMNIHIVRAENSDRWSSLEISQVQKLVESNEQQGGSDQGMLHSHILGNSGHWVHVDNPDRLINILTLYFVNM